jgi:hypothetical protein
MASAAHASVESWYTYWGIGFAGNSYDRETDEFFDSTEDRGDVGRISISADLWGFYWPLKNQRTIAGFVVNSTSDVLYGTSDENEDVTVTLTTQQYSGSVMHFFKDEPGSGWFVRGDLGFCLARFAIDDSDGEDLSETSDVGFGALAGGGYGWPISEETRLMLTGYVSHREFGWDGGDGKDTIVGFTFGGLW